MDTEGINHPLLEQLNLSCKYSAERRSVASCYHGSKSSTSQQSLSLDRSAKKKLEFPAVLWASSSLILLAWDNYLLILGIREIVGNEVACPCWALTILLTDLQSPSVSNY